MNRLTPVWTDTHFRLFAVLLFAVSATALAAAAEAPWVAALTALLVLLTAIASLCLDTFIAVFVGFASAAVIIAVKRWLGEWTPAEFYGSLAAALLMVATAASGGIAAAALRRLAQAAGAKTAAQSVFGSMGLLSAELGEIRLDSEVQRARKYNRPLALLRVAVTFRDPVALESETKEAVSRAVARLIESMVRVIDVPFAFSADHIVVILPETRVQDAWLVMARLAEAVELATFTAGADRARHQVRDYASLGIAVASFPENGADARDLLRHVDPAEETPVATVTAAAV